jgi:hypothetical protein
LIQKDIIARFNHFRRNIAIAAYTRWISSIYCLFNIVFINFNRFEIINI